jgi:hypothetical protein
MDENLQRFAQRGSAHLQIGGELLLPRDAVAADKRARGNRVAQRLDDAVNHVDAVTCCP